MKYNNGFLEFLKEKENISILLIDTSNQWTLCSYWKLNVFLKNNVWEYSIESSYIKEEINNRDSFQKLSLYIKEIVNKFSFPEFIIVGLGPGSFTGVRIAVSAARTLSQLLNIPVIAIDSLTLYSLYIYQKTQLYEFYIAIYSIKKYFVKKFDSQNYQNPILELSTNEILSIINDKYNIFTDRLDESFLNYSNIKIINMIQSEYILKMIFSNEFLKNSSDFFKKHYSEIIPIYIRKDPANEKFPEGLIKK